MKNAKGILSGLPKRCYRNTSKCPNCGEMLCARYKPKFCPKCNAETGGTHEPKAKKQRISKCAEIYTIENYRLFSVRTSTKDDRCFTVMSTGMETICHAAQCKNLRSIYVASGKTEQFTCQHLDIIRATPEDLRSSICSVQCFSHEEIDDFTPDEKIRCEMKKIQNDCFPAVVKVSQKMYAVKGSATASNPTGYCHVKAESAQSQTLGKYQVPLRLNCCSEDCSGKKYGRTKQVKSRSLCIHIHCTILAMKIKEELSTVDRPTDQPDFDYSDSVASTSLTVRPSGTPHDSGVQTEVRHDVYSAQSTQDQDDMSLWLLSSGLSISKVSTLQLQLKRKLPYKIPVNILQKLTFMDSKHIPNLGGGPLLSYSSDREDNIKVDKSCCTFHPKSSICVLCSPSYAGIDYDGETHSFFEGWPDCFQPSESECLVCSASLSDSMTPQGSVTSYNGFMFTNQNPFKKVTIKVKKCLNTNCRAVHQTFLYDIGLFNVANKILIGIDILLEWRELFKQGFPLSNVIEAKINSLLLKIDEANHPPENSYLQQLLYNGLYGFECMTVRDLDDTICGLCGIVGQVYFGDGNEKNCCSLTEVDMHIDQEDSERTSNETSLETYLEKVKALMLERCVFAKPELKFTTKIKDIPPIIPHSLRRAQLNTEVEKKSKYLENSNATKTEGDPILLDKYMRERGVNISDVDKFSKDELVVMCKFCKISISHKSNDMLRSDLQALYATILVGTSPCHEFTKSAGHSGGFYHLVCRHGCTVASKFLILTESVRDAADLYLSLRYPPVTFVCDTPCTLVRHMNNRVPDVTSILWGNFDGCFEKPTLDREPANGIDLPFLVPSEYHVSDNQSESEESGNFVHPLTKTSRRFIVGDRFHTATNPHKSPLCKYHDINLCLQGNTVKTSYQESMNNSKNIKRLRSSCVQNFHTHFLYNYLMDFYENEAIVRRQRKLHSKTTDKALVRDCYQRFVFE